MPEIAKLNIIEKAINREVNTTIDIQTKSNCPMGPEYAHLKSKVMSSQWSLFGFEVMVEFNECGLVQFTRKRLPASEMFAGACTEAFYQLEHVLWCELFLTGYS